jgi:hypothetical protein
MRRVALLLILVGVVNGVPGFAPTKIGHADEKPAPIFVSKIPSGYRDWKSISVAHEEGNLNDIRAILGNDTG